MQKTCKANICIFFSEDVSHLFSSEGKLILYIAVHMYILELVLISSLYSMILYQVRYPLPHA